MPNTVLTLRDAENVPGGGRAHTVRSAWSSVNTSATTRRMKRLHPGLAVPAVDAAGAETAATEAMIVDADPEHAALGSLALNQGPISDIVATADGRVLVANHGRDSVSVMNAATRSTTTVTGTNEPFMIVASPSGDHRAYVTTVSDSGAYDTISVIDTEANSMIASYPMGLSVRSLVVSRDGKRVYASGFGQDGADVAVIDTATTDVCTIGITVGSGASAEALCPNPAGDRLYVATTDGELVVIETATNRIVDSIQIGAPIRGVAVSRDGGTVYVTSFGYPQRGGAVDVIDTATNQWMSSVEVGGLPAGLTMSVDGASLYVINEGHVDVIRTATSEVVDTLVLGDGAQPSAVTISADGTRLYIADYTGSVSAFAVDATPRPPLVTRVEVGADRELVAAR